MDPALSNAIALAAAAHGGETDKTGRPYITHPILVMLRCEEYGPLVQMTAVLHDVVEDTWVTLDLLRAIGYPPEVVDAVDAISRRKTVETYEHYIERCSRNRIAALVKLADIEDNSDPARRFGDRYEETMEKYRRASRVLRSSLNGKASAGSGSD